MNERSKLKMHEQKKGIVEGLKTHLPDIPFFEDEIAEDEERLFINDGKYYAFVLRMGDFIPTNTSMLTQSFFIDYYSEERDDVDETLIDIISIVSKIPTVSFIKTSKMRLRAGETDRFVDVISLEFRRLVKYDS